MLNNNPNTNFPFKAGDKVRSKVNPNEQGEICCISYTTKIVRVYVDAPFGKIVKWYDVDELELIEEKT